MGAVVTAVVVCACGMTGPYQDPNYAQQPYGQQQQQPYLQQPQQPATNSVKEHATFKVDSVERVFTLDDGSKISECDFKKTDTSLYIGFQVVSADGKSSMKLALNGLDPNRVSAQWSGRESSAREVTLDLNTRDTNSRYGSKIRSYTADCTIYYEIDGKLLRVRHFSCDSLQNASGDKRTGSGEFACYQKSNGSDIIR